MAGMIQADLFGHARPLRKRGGQFGHTVSEEARRKMSEAKRGKRVSIRTEFKPGQRASPGTEFQPGNKINTLAPDHTFICNTSGYQMVRSPNGPNGWRREHTVIAERVLGRHLKPGEEVHHINGDKLDNRNSNLLICNSAYHRELERRMAVLYQRKHFEKL